MLKSPTSGTYGMGVLFIWWGNPHLFNKLLGLSKAQDPFLYKCVMMLFETTNLVTTKWFSFNINIDHIQGNDAIKTHHWMGKINFVETRSFWHIFRSFDRMWGFFILCLQVSPSISFVYFFSFILHYLYDR